MLSAFQWVSLFGQYPQIYCFFIFLMRHLGLFWTAMLKKTMTALNFQTNEVATSDSSDSESNHSDESILDSPPKIVKASGQVKRKAALKPVEAEKPPKRPVFLLNFFLLLFYLVY